MAAGGQGVAVVMMVDPVAVIGVVADEDVDECCHNCHSSDNGHDHRLTVR